VLHTGFRQGDAAEMALIELVDFNEAALASAPKAEKKATRRSRAKKAEAPAQAEAAPAAEQKAEE
jgi:large subunit ribosomal protein L17